MRTTLLLILLLLAYKNGFSQNQIEIYRNGILGGMYIQQEQYDSAEKYYRKALAMMPDKTKFPQYFTLIRIADKHKDKKRISEYLTALSCIYPKDSIYNHLKEWAEVTMDRIIFDSLYHPHCKLAKEKDFIKPHPKAADSLIALIKVGDQGIRTKVNHRSKTATEEELQALEKEMHEVDSTDFVLLNYCITKYGMPVLSGDLNGSRVTQLMHIDNYDHFKKIDSYLVKAIKDGVLCPIAYAYALDRSLTASGIKPKYYWFIPKTSAAEKNIPNAKDLDKVNHDRALIGLPPYPMWTGWGFDPL